MPYPKDLPTCKHDLFDCSRLQSCNGMDTSLNKIFQNATQLFYDLEKGIHPQVVKKLSSIYSYPDSPQKPKYLSRSLTIIGLAKTSLRLVQTIVQNDNDPRFHKCTLGVKRGDSSYASHLNQKNLENSQQFANLMKLLRKEDSVAITGSDKHGRFCILQPMEPESKTNDNGVDNYQAEDFAAVCFVVNKDDAKRALVLYASSSNQRNQRAQTKAQHIEDDSLQQNQEDGNASFRDENTVCATIEREGGDTNARAITKKSGDVLTHAGQKRKKPTNDSHIDSNRHQHSKEKHTSSHADPNAAATDNHYSDLLRSLETRPDSNLYHMRGFNGWVKATQIAELDPITASPLSPSVHVNKDTHYNEKRRKSRRHCHPLRVLDLGCGKGGDLQKWILHSRGIDNYVGIDAAKGSLQDAAVRARKFFHKHKRFKRCTFTYADLGADVPGRFPSPTSEHMQTLESWSLEQEQQEQQNKKETPSSSLESKLPKFHKILGGGISLKDKFDVVSIQFAIHYLMSSRQRAKRFFRTVSELLDDGGNLIVTTIDSRVVVEHLMGLGLDLYNTAHSKADDEKVEIHVGGGACKLQFDRNIVQRIFCPKGAESSSKRQDDVVDNDLFGLEYIFTLVEGTDHASGVGDVVNLPEWLTPIPVLVQLAKDDGLQVDYVQNFHEFHVQRATKDPGSATYDPQAHNRLYQMSVLNRHGSISQDEWDISRLYVALKFTKETK